jgi:glycolate oxidase iron-sulfur subunit
VARPLGERIARAALREGLTRRWLFDPAMRIGQAVRPVLPAALKAKVPARRAPGAWPARVHPRKVLLPAGCVQPAMMPAIDAATARVLDALGIEAIVARGSGCCGAIRHHLGDTDGARDDARRNIDAWWPWIEGSVTSRTDGGAMGAARGRGVEAIVVNASGCGAMFADYAHLLRDDPAYADKAVTVASLARDLSVVIAPERERLAGLLAPPAVDARRVAFHPPCTLQHAQQVRGAVEAVLAACGAELLPFAEPHLCCGSAGTYSVLQPDLSRRLRDRKLGALQADAPQAILSANVGCLAQLQSGTDTPVRHWVEWVDARLGAGG